MALRALARSSSLLSCTSRGAMPSVRAFSATTDTVPNSIDHGFEKNRIDKVANPDSREFTYLMLGGTRFVYASAVRLGVINFVSSMSASKDVLALASAEFNLSAIDVGQTVTVKWRGKPVFIKRRTPEEIATCEEVPLSALRDPEDDASRAERSEWLICLAICTHLGCVPISNAGEYGGWFCPCHGSHYDASGRIRKGPAPLNLEIPPYAFTSDDVVVLG